MSPTTVPGNFVIQSPTANDPLLDLNTQPSLDLQFATSKTLDDRVSGLPLVDLQRDVSSGKSAGTYVDSTGVIRTSKANLNTYSEDATVWDYNLITAPTAPTSDVISPAGLQSSFKLLETTGTGEHYFRLAKTVVTSGSIYTQSIYIKPTLGRTKIRVYNFAQNNLVFIWDLVNNLEVSAAGGTSYSASSTAVGDGWYRFVFTDEATSVNFRSSFMTVTDSNQFNFAGDTTKGFYVTGAQLEEGSTASPYIKTTNLPSAAPRFDHDPTTNASLGLLVEESRTNLLTYSENFSSWIIQTGASITANQGIAPDGTLTASFLTGTGMANNGVLSTPSASVSTTSNNTKSIYLRSVSGTPSVSLKDPYLTVNRQVVNLTTEWQRFSLTEIQPSGLAGIWIDEIPAEGIYAWGAQLEAGAFATSYIPTSGSTVTRAADEASITGSNFTSFWNSEKEGTLFFEHDLNPETQTGNPTNSMIIAFSTSLTTYNGPTLGLWGSGDSRYFPTDYSNGTYNTDGWPTRTDLLANLGITLANPGKDRYAVGYKVGTGLSNLAINGTLLGARDTSADYIPTGLYFGGSHNQRISRLTYYPKRLPDIELQQLTK